VNFDNKNIFLGNLPDNVKPSLAIFLSGSGSNAEKLLSDADVKSSVNFSVLVTDAPEKSRAEAIGAKFGLPVVSSSIRQFYRDHGLNTISLATEAGRNVRELWTAELRNMLKDYPIDFGVLAGFEPLCNITNDFPCLNVHPGDLSKVDANGNRCYVGLHSRPVEAAILAGEKELRSSVILAGGFSDASKDMDNGLLLGVSGGMSMDFGDLTLEELRGINALRTGKKPAGGWPDKLAEFASLQQDLLKVAGDHIILPLVVRDFARKCFALADDKLYYRASTSEPFCEAKSNNYDANGLRII
jgi:folate-dependent phosphoribosylglycinamide formyltransferase PurN